MSVTGTNGKTTVTRMAAGVAGALGKTVGMTTTDGIWNDGHRVAAGDNSARVALGDPAVEGAVLETARGGRVRRSLGYDWSDVGVITNVSADHLGQDGIETADDPLQLKSLVAERVREGGTTVLNADDPVARDHLAAGGTAFWGADGWLWEGTGPKARRLGREADIPATLGGVARFQVANALAPTAASRALGLSAGRVRRRPGRQPRAAPHAQGHGPPRPPARGGVAAPVRSGRRRGHGRRVPAVPDERDAVRAAVDGSADYEAVVAF